MDHGWGNAKPVFRVASLADSIAYYVNVLGFKLDWSHEHSFASVSRARCGIFLCEGDQGHPGAWTWIGVPDARAVHDELVARGARVRHPPANFEWALEMQVEDLDGNVLRLGSDPIADMPFGPWRDMNGVLWTKTESGWAHHE